MWPWPSYCSASASACKVTARYVFDHAFGWGEELPIFLFLWVSFMAAAVAYRDGNHLSVDFIVAKFPKKLRYAIYYLNLALSLLFMGVLIYYETGMTKSAMHSTFVVLKISKAYCYVGYPDLLFLVRAIYHRTHDDQKPQASRR